MTESEKEQVAQQVADLRMIFYLALSNKRKYPVQQFKAFVRSARRGIPPVSDSTARPIAVPFTLTDMNEHAITIYVFHF